MAYSNTTGKTKINVDQLISYAFRDAGKTAEEITPEYIDAAKQALFYNLMDLSNMGVNLWLLENILLGAQTDQQILTLPSTTIDIREANWVYVQNYTPNGTLPVNNASASVLFSQDLAPANFATSTLSENYFGAAYSPEQRIFYVGFNAYSPNTTTTYNLAYETSYDGVNWTNTQILSPVTLGDYQWAYFNVNITQPYPFYRLRNLNTATTFSLRQIVFSQSQQVIPLARLNRDDYWNLPNKQFPSVRSLQYWFDRTIEPSMYLWPVPNNNFQMFQLIVDVQMQDVGSLTNEIYVPDRWLPAIQAQLSHKLSIQLPGVDMPRIQYLEMQAEKLFQHASDEDRDKSPIYFQPNISYYTR
jgi:hypothetical protein